MIPVKKLDGSTMYITVDRIERVEPGAEGQSAIYLIDGSHYVVANDPIMIVGRIRREKAALLARAVHGPDTAAEAENEGPVVTKLGRVGDP